MVKTHAGDGSGDFEDWHECIARAMIARRAGMDFGTDADIGVDTPFCALAEAIASASASMDLSVNAVAPR